MRRYQLALLISVLLLVLASCGCNKLKARDQLNKGVGAFRNSQYQAAIVHFKTAVALDPSLLNARLYLATAYAQQYIPGGESEENVKIGKQAIEAFEDVLKLDPQNLTAIASIAQTYYNMKDFEKAKEYQRRRLQISPTDPEPYYWVGVIDWAVAYRKNGEVRRDLKLNIPTAKGELLPLPEKSRAALENEVGTLVDEGLSTLQKALELKPNDADAMVYLNLMYRQKADLMKEASARAEYTKQADEWQQKALGIKKTEASKASGGGTVPAEEPAQP